MMAQYKWYCLVLILFVFSCKTPQPITNGGNDMTVKDGTGKNDTVTKKVGVDGEISKFRITYNVKDAYEEFGAPKIIKEVDGDNQTPNEVREIISKDHINEDLEKKLANIRYVNDDIEKVMGYRILIYSGNNVGKAQNLHADLRVALSGTGHSSRLHYDPPNYILKAGKFVSKLKAHQLFTQLKEDFPRAVLITEEMNFNRSKYIVD